MSEKRPATLWDRVQLEAFGWTWIMTWIAAIWHEPFRWQLFATGAVCLFLGVTIVGGVDLHSKPSTNTTKGR